MSKNTPNMGLWMLTALVAGNMIGSGIFLLPANLFSLGTINLWGWGITMTGALLLAYIFVRFSVLVPKAGGPYIYVK